MSVRVYYRSIDSMHPAKAFQIRERAQQIADQFSWILCDTPTFGQEKDGHLKGQIAPFFDVDEDSFSDVATSTGDLMDAIEILRLISREHSVDWEFSHEYEPQGIGRIVGGEVETDLIEEIQSVVQVGNLFGDVGLDEEMLEEEWEQSPSQFGVWRATIHEASAKYANDKPHVLKFPGVK